MNVKKQISDFFVERNVSLGDNFVQLHLYTHDKLPEINPGQFVQIQIPSSIHGWLRIPISIHDAEAEKGKIKLLVQKVGDGSRWISALHEGAKLNMVLPLGRGFSWPEISLRQEVEDPKNAAFRALLVGGGCGLAPLYYLAKCLES